MKIKENNKMKYSRNREIRHREIRNTVRFGKILNLDLVFVCIILFTKHSEIRKPRDSADFLCISESESRGFYCIALIQHITYDSFAEIDEKACKEII